jgi:hypothetical protein
MIYVYVFLKKALFFISPYKININKITVPCIYTATLRFGDNSTYALMSLDFPKRSARKILERIIPPPSGGRDEHRTARFTTALRAWYNSSYKLQRTTFLKLGSHYQRVSFMRLAL